MTTRLLILDFDGTLADTAGGIVATMNATFRTIGRPEADAGDICQTIGLPLTQSIALLAGIREEAELQHAVDTYHRLFETIGVQATDLFPHVHETLRRLHDEGLAMAIATSRGGKSVRALCAKLGIAPYLTAYVAEEDVENKKPAPDAVRMLLDMTHTPAEVAWVVGDTVFDIEMGHRAGCPACGVTYGNHPRAHLEAAGADRLIDDFAQLPSILHD